MSLLHSQGQELLEQQLQRKARRTAPACPLCVCVCVCVCVERETLKAFQNEVASVLRFGVGGGQRGTCLVEKLLPMM